MAMQIQLKEKTKLFGRVFGCERCGRKRGLVRRHGLRFCRQCFRDTAAAMGFKKYT